MSNPRPVYTIVPARPTLEGAGVKLHRAFAMPDARLDPFLLFDDFSSGRQADYLPGFPWHPHRGIETITYMLSGTVAHHDSLGNKGVIGPGQVQWMTAGSGIIHEEMPQPSKMLAGFQLWANLPAEQKMTAPRYRDVHADDIPVVKISKGVEAKIICGKLDGISGPVKEIVTDPQYIHFLMAAGTNLKLPVPQDHNVFAYVIEGGGKFGKAGEWAASRHMVVFDEGEDVIIEVDKETHLLLMSGKPLREPVAWRGPIVMNTDEELDLAFEEFRNGTFIKKTAGSGQ